MLIYLNTIAFCATNRNISSFGSCFRTTNDDSWDLKEYLNKNTGDWFTYIGNTLTSLFT